MKRIVIDINSDLGEGVGNENDLMPSISSCNIACGGHAGDRDSMRSMIHLALENGVKIGAHPSYPDKLNFGRKPVKMSDVELQNALMEQLMEFELILETAGGVLHHIKLHGALYSASMHDIHLAELMVDVIKRVRFSGKIYTPANSALAEAAKEHDIPVMFEAFADRSYNDNGSLVSRQHPGALITDIDQMTAQVLSMVLQKKVMSIQNAFLPIKAETLCIHSDTPNAATLASQLTDRLRTQGIEIG